MVVLSDGHKIFISSYPKKPEIIISVQVFINTLDALILYLNKIYFRFQIENYSFPFLARFHKLCNFCYLDLPMMG